MQVGPVARPAAASCLTFLSSSVYNVIYQKAIIQSVVARETIFEDFASKVHVI